ncbi:MAG: phosphoglycolate phosphatase [Proteobacteria bacterium]|nr:phosphoglycolate phosphatase [Pseudomonadota bacterium]
MKLTFAGGAAQAVLFDLDGTLLDTADDIALALNRTLGEQSLKGLDVAQVRLFIGRGVPTLIQRALRWLGQSASTADASRLLERFHFHYHDLAKRGDIRTRVYPGVSSGLAALKEMPLGIAVVTNKPRAAALELLEHFQLDRWIDTLVGGDSGLAQKPHPDPLLHACGQLRATPARTLMVGDSMTDVLAARGAGMQVVCVPYGYNEGSDPRQLPCDGLIENVAALPGLLADDAPVPARVVPS